MVSLFSMSGKAEMVIASISKFLHGVEAGGKFVPFLTVSFTFSHILSLLSFLFLRH